MKLTTKPGVFASGECVEPGLYRDVETGATVRVYEPDELPDGARIVRVPRFFRRVDESATDWDLSHLNAERVPIPLKR